MGFDKDFMETDSGGWNWVNMRNDEKISNISMSELSLIRCSFILNTHK